MTVGFTSNSGEVSCELQLAPRDPHTGGAFRRLAQDLSHPLITMLQLECTRATCPEMKAGEWLYLCVAHGTEGAMEVWSIHHNVQYRRIQPLLSAMLCY